MSLPIICGPLLRYTYVDFEANKWNGSLLIVLQGEDEPSSLHLSCGMEQTQTSDPKNVFAEHGHTFWRYPLVVQLTNMEQCIEYNIVNSRIHGSFCVPAKNQSMRIMFHSCNGFSVKIPEDTYTGPALWNDVLRVHAEFPFHVMIGGGDQIYSDRLCVNGPLKTWARESKPRRRAKTPFTLELSKELDEWYFNNYITWYNTSPFREASAVIPSLQIWDDHDIIDGYGSYRDRFMRTPVFLGIGNVAHKYYFLFQQHTSPSEIEKAPDPSFVLGTRLGPYIPSLSVSLCSNLGPRTVFFGLECRIERTRKRICYDSTYDAMFARLDKEVKTGQTKHLILLLGVPIAYPRLVWLEGILGSSLITTPIKWSNKVFGVGGGLFNNFDGSAELLDDLNDHWCAVTHKRERNTLVARLQAFAAAKQVRITILSGDVHLAAVGRFFSAPRFKIPQNKDPRYMVNIVSSAITNAPPPNAVANLIHRRNKVHFLNRKTQENLMSLFREDPQGKLRKSSTTMPARNYAIITEHAGLARQISSEYEDGNTYANGIVNGAIIAGGADGHYDLQIAKKERGGTTMQDVSAAAPSGGTTRPYALDVAFRVEVESRNPEGRTKAYGFSIPALEV
ncbi:hypothetical protein K439DRAFT_1629920 [Ramaria rubella]|nr:hypothetical protein K439DRAFT_1629920 [Ramaria rubella]